MDGLIGPTANGRLVSVVNAAGLVLDGIIFGPSRARLAIVHVHGSLGNFYQQQFVRVFANRLAEEGIAVLSFNLTAHDGVSEGYTTDGEMRYVGGSLSTFETCLDDLEALWRFAGSISPKVALQGHSLGCDRVLFYVQQRARGVPMILLSPCDSRRLQEQWLGGEEISTQVARLSRDVDDEEIKLVSASEYGVTGPDGWTYSIPVSRRTLLSIVDGPPFDILHVDELAQPVSGAPAFVYMGANDAIRGVGFDEMREHVGRLLPASHVFAVAGGDHSLDGCAAEVADAILKWTYDVGLLSGRR